MVRTRNPAGEGGASDGSVHAAKLNTSDHTRASEPHQVVRDCLMGSGAAPAAITTAASIAVVGTPTQDRAWWTEEAGRVGSDWGGIIATHIGVLAGLIERGSRQ